MARLGPIALTLITFIVFAGFWDDESSAAANKQLATASSNHQIAGLPIRTAGLRPANPRVNRLKRKSSKLPQTNSDSNISTEKSSQDASKSLTIEKKSVETPGSSLEENLSSTNKKTTSEMTLSLPQAIRIAIARNLTMANSRLAAQEKEYQRREAYSDFFPSITLQGAATWDRYWNPLFYMGLYGNNNSTYAYQQQQVRLENVWDQAPAGNKPFAYPNPNGSYPYRIDPYRQFIGALTITQPIFSGGKLINDYKYARLGVDYSDIQFEIDRQDLTLNVNQAYYQMMQAEKLLEVSNAAIRALEALVRQSREFYKAGTVAKVDVLSAEGQLAQARIQRTQSIADIAQNQATLNYLLRNPQETPVEIIEDMSYEPSQYKLPDVYAIAAANRLEIRQANISVDQAMAMIKSAKAAVLPNVDLAIFATRYNDDWNVVDPEAFGDSRIQGLLSWTFDLFRKRSTIAERRTTEARAFVNRELLVETVMNEVKQAYEDMRRNFKNIADNKASVEFQTENFRINLERYKEQVNTYVEVLDAQRQLQLAQGNYYIAICGFKINQATLERRMGILK
ncbi:MAG: TolC family protein [Desulfomonilaceae bacterium]